VIDLASGIAREGVFIIPQAVAPFRSAGQPGRVAQRPPEYARFEETTGLVLQEGVTVDTALSEREWRSRVPRVEIVTCDFEAQRDALPQGRRGSERAAVLPGMERRDTWH
jgi:hypothetical protein